MVDLQGGVEISEENGGDNAEKDQFDSCEIGEFCLHSNGLKNRVLLFPLGKDYTL